MEQRQLKFRAWAKKNISVGFELAQKEADKKFPVEPKNGTKEWSKWHDKREAFLQVEYRKNRDIPDTHEFVMIDNTKFAVGHVDIVQYGYDLIHVMQFTGEADKNNKEVYDGDFLKNPAVFGVVRYIDSYCAFVLCTDKENGYEFSEYTTFMPLYMANLEICEVVGNIYQNPELLK